MVSGPAINAIITINPHALERAEELDSRFAAQGLAGELHGNPVIVKDHYDTGNSIRGLLPIPRWPAFT